MVSLGRQSLLHDEFSLPPPPRRSASRRAGLRIDSELDAAIVGVRPNRQVNVQGDAQLLEDERGYWTRRMTPKYVGDPEGERMASVGPDETRTRRSDNAWISNPSMQPTLTLCSTRVAGGVAGRR